MKNDNNNSNIPNNINAIINYFKDIYDKPFVGWDFSNLNNEIVSEELSWNYKEIVESYLTDKNVLLDMGTGGGEFLTSIKNLPKDTSATEGYEPNYHLARKYLEPKNIKVYFVDDDNSLPIEDNSFDIVINRHESYSASEVYRILKPNGIFITQQVGGDDLEKLNQVFDATDQLQYKHWNLGYAMKELEENNFEIIFSNEEKPATTFKSIEAVLRYLKAVPWQIPNFNINDYYNNLIELDNYIKSNNGLKVNEHRFIIISKKR